MTTLLPASAGAQECDADGRSDGEDASAEGGCGDPGGEDPGDPGGGPVTTVRCGTEIVVFDDWELALFPGLEGRGRVVAGYEPPGGISVDIGGEGGKGLIVDVIRDFEDHGDPTAGTFISDDDLARLFSFDGTWYREVCTDLVDGGGRRAGDDGFDPEDDPERVVVEVVGPYPTGDAESLDDLLERARALVDPPEPPELLFAGPYSITQAHTFWWVDEGWWETDYVDRGTHGRTWVEVETDPVDYWIYPGPLGEAQWCDGRGLTWERGQVPDDGETCTYMYRQASAGRGGGDAFELEFDVRLIAWWTTSVAGYGIQPLEPLQRVTLQGHEVGEIQAIEAPPRSP